MKHNGVFTFLMIVTAKRYIESAGRWEYQLDDTSGLSYNNGQWVTETNLTDAT